MTSRQAQLAQQSDPQHNPGFRRWPAPAYGVETGVIRAWHSPDLAQPGRKGAGVPRTRPVTILFPRVVAP